jgi:glycosyltransferase involved in cell wall biosynthesis
MRILLVSEDIPQPSLGGLAQHVMRLARALIKAGHVVDLLGNNQYPLEISGTDGQFNGQFYGELYSHLRLWKEKQLGVFLPPKRPWIAKKMAQTIIKHAPDYDVIHYHGHLPNIAKYIPASINFVQTRHDQGSDCVINTRFREGNICTSKNPFDCASCITTKPNIIQRTISATAVSNYRQDVAEAFRLHKTIFVSELLQRNFSRTAGTEKWGTVVHNFIEIEKFKMLLAEQPQQNKAKDKTLLNIFIAGMFYPPKGIEALLNILASVMPTDMHIDIAGDGPDESRLREIYKNKPINFLGWCTPDITLNLANQADIIVVPSIWEEPCATTVFEGLLLQKPTFALAQGGTPELKIYERYPGQLHLFKTMEALVAELIKFKPEKHLITELDERASVTNAIPRLLEIYSLSTGT